MRLDELNNMFFEEQWGYIEKEIIKLIKILEGSPDQPPFDAKDYIMLYTMIYNLSIQKSPYEYPRQLYDRFKQIFDHYIVTKVLLSLKEKHDEYLLRELVIRWKNHKVMVKWLQRFFQYIDRFYVVQNGVLELRVVGLTSFHDLVYKEYYANARDTVITLINREREGEQIDGSLLKNTIDIFVEIGMGNMDLYENDFEKQLLDDTANYYKNRAANWIEDDSCPDYMLKAEDCMKKERERAFRYLYPSSEQKLLERVQHLLLKTHANQLFEKEHSGCIALFRDDKVEDLSRMYRLYHNLPKCLEYVANVLKQHVKAEGTALIKEAEAANKNQVLVREFIELRDKYMPYVNECFMRHILFYKALKEAFTVFCNKTIAGITSAELLATFCDSILKKGGREKLSDDEIEETLEKMVWLLSHVDDKDLLAEFCRKKLARRLLFDRSASEDHEMSFLSKLKGQFGAHFTSKMEGMIIDLTLAGDHQIKNRIQEFIHSVNGIDFTVTVLTSGIWPSYKSFDLNLPSEMAKCLDIFKRFYELKTKRRKLTWIYSLGICNINGMFEPKTIELIMSTYQAAVLLLFNKADRLSYSEIKAELNVTNEDLVRLLHSLSSARYQILIKEPNTGTISPNDSFEFNSKFTDRMRRIKIPLPPVDERKKVIEDVAKDRRYAIDAAIVRIMKSRKILSYQQIVAECVEMLSPTFKPDVKEIKRRIEDLINRDYLERDAKNSDLFNYRA